MPCFSPITSWVSLPGPSGKREIAFKRSRSTPIEMPLPCGQCIWCKLERSRQWAIRCVHESELHADNCSLTLTYDDAHLPADRSLDVSHLQLFWKRLRKRFPRSRGDGIKYFQCGEYGEACRVCRLSRKLCESSKLHSFVPGLGRPHYHACVFNFDFSDKVPEKRSVSGSMLYRSPALDDLWGQGKALLGDVSFESAAYVARYCLKKISGKDASAHYEGRLPEFVTMSRGGNVKGSGGIGKAWFDRFASDVFPSDFVVVRGRKVRPPKFYDVQLESRDPEAFLAVKASRKGKAVRVLPRHRFVVDSRGRFSRNDNSYDRLSVKEVVKRAQIRSLSRSMEASDEA